MNKRNYQKELEEIISQIKKDGKRRKLFLHSCCAPCSSYCLLYLAEYFEIIDYFYNPNISPKDEYDKRTEELSRLVDTFNREKGYSITLIEGEYEPERFYNAVRGYEDCMEGGERCFICYKLRLEETAKLAKQYEADYFTTTLTISPLKNAEKINEIGEELSKIYDVSHLPSDFKKRDGYKQSVKLSAEYDLYRQNFCGCVYSKKEAKIRESKNKI